MYEISLVTSFYLGFCAGAAIVALLFSAALGIASRRERHRQRLGLDAPIIPTADDSTADDSTAIEAKGMNDQDKPGSTQLFTQSSAQLLADRIRAYSEHQSIVFVLEEYASALQLLDDYDHARLTISKDTLAQGPCQPIDYEQAIAQITLWRERANLGSLFGNEKDDSFAGSLHNVHATFDGHDLYPSTEEKAARLLYFIVKNHSFSDGNKRIGAAFFIWFLQRNQCLTHPQGYARIAGNALVAITLLIAQSDPANREILIALVVKLIQGCGEIGELEQGRN